MEADGLVQVCNGLVVLFKVIVDGAAIVKGYGQIGFEADSLAVVGKCFVELANVFVNVAEATCAVTLRAS